MGTHGTLVVTATAGRALRKTRADVRMSDVLGVAGDFAPGQRVNLTMRGKDGGQNVVGTAVMAVAAEAIAARSIDASTVVATGAGLEVYWFKPA
jgi:glutamate 5-kinase